MKVSSTAAFILLLTFVFVVQPASAQSTTNPDANAGAATSANAPQVHPTATVYSEGYELRRKIHRYASFATLPLFGAELALGQSVYNSTTGGDSANKAAHIAVGSSIIGLFGVNAVTGVWNMWEDRHNPEGRALRITHGVLMIAANAGFAATAATAPGNERRRGTTTLNDGNRALHRDLAVGSIGVGTVGYVLMLFRKH